MIAVFLAILLVNIFIVIYWSRTSLLSTPSKFNILFWTINIVVGVCFFRNYDWKYEGIVYILLMVDLFAVAFSIGKNYVIKPKHVGTINFNAHRVDSVMTIGMVAGFIYLIELIRNNGFSIQNILNFSSLFSMGHYFVDGKYGSTVIMYSVIGQISLAVNYAIAIVSGFVFKLELREKYKSFLFAIPLAIVTIVTTAKAHTIIGALLWVSGYLTALIYCDDTKKHTKIFKRIMLAIVVVAVGFATLYLAFYVRYGAGTDSQLIFNKFIMYALGHVPCFDKGFYLFQKTIVGEGFGYYTFQGFAEKLPISAPNMNKFLVFNLDTEYGDTQIRTMFGDILMDFGLVGSVFVMLLIGLIAGIAYASAKRNKNVIGITFVAVIYFAITYSFLISPFRYDSILIAFIFFAIAMHYSKERSITSNYV